jgi:putative endonuclease
LEALARGAEAEAMVATALEASGWTVLARNWRGGNGEIDVVVERDGCLRFVEVKARDAADPLADEAITAHKQRRLLSAAETWLQDRGERWTEACFLVALVALGEQASIEWIDDAFDAD